VCSSSSATVFGCVNHAALTIRWAETAGLDLAGYVINTLQPEPDLAMETNVELLHDTLGPSLGVFPWVGETACSEADRARLAEIAEQSLRLDELVSPQREDAKTRRSDEKSSA
jgi:dethiobiotin synthetase